MNASEVHDLLARIEVFEFDKPGTQLTFASRLAREQGWTHAFAGRVLTEYKRFIGLAIAAGHPVTPSEEVDQAWHLHLVYTKSYWRDLCRNVLGRELHHEPTTGGAEEGEKFTDWYARTLESYRRVFHDDPPLDIWPTPEQRFSGNASARWVDPAQHWIIRKPGCFKPKLRLNRP